MEPNGSVIVKPVKERMYTRLEVQEVITDLLRRLSYASLELMKTEQREGEYIERWLNKNYPQ